LDAFTPSAVARAEARAALGVRSDELLVGIVGRFHPMKDHRTFVSAAAVARKSLANLRILMVGEGLGPENGVLDEWLHTAGMRDACLRLGRRRDLPALYAAMDLCVLSSRIGEGFPNVLGEAMACGVPCVATDVG